MSMLTKTQREDLRFALLAEIVNARSVAFPADVFLRRVNRRAVIDFEVTVAEAEDAIAALHAAGLVQMVPNRLSESPHYQATPAGVRVAEGRA